MSKCPNVFLMMVPLSSITFTSELSDRGRREGSNTEGARSLWFSGYQPPFAPVLVVTFGDWCGTPCMLASSPPTCTGGIEKPSLTFCTDSSQQIAFQSEVNESFTINATFLTCNIYYCHLEPTWVLFKASFHVRQHFLLHLENEWSQFWDHVGILNHTSKWYISFQYLFTLNK